MRVARPRAIWRQLREALTLILAATSILVGGVAAVFVLEGHFRLSRAWVLFGTAAAGYTLMTFYLLNQIGPLRNRFRVTKMLAATMVMEAPVVALSFLFYRDILALPESMLPYTIGGIVVAPAMAMLIESFVLSGRNTPWSKPTEG